MFGVRFRKALEANACERGGSAGVIYVLCIFICVFVRSKLLMLQLLLFLTNHLPAIANGWQNGIHHQRSTVGAHNIRIVHRCTNKHVTRIFIFYYMDHNIVFSYCYGRQRNQQQQQYTSNAGNFDCHVDAVVQCGAHRPMELIPGFTRSHWMPPSSECLHRIATAAAMVKNMCATRDEAIKRSILRVFRCPIFQIFKLIIGERHNNEVF